MHFVCALISRLITKMVQTNIIDLLSISAGVSYLIPIILYYLSGNIVHIIAFMGISVTTLVSEMIKYLFIGKISPRPQGARNCNLLCNDGIQEGRPGMPSSHSAEVVFFSAYYYQITDNTFIRVILIVYALLVMGSRYLKKCHTINQIMAGALLGALFSYFTVRLL